MDLEKIQNYIEQHRKDMSLKQKLKIEYLPIKYKLEDLFNKL